MDALLQQQGVAASAAGKGKKGVHTATSISSGLGLLGCCCMHALACCAVHVQYIIMLSRSCQPAAATALCF